MFGQYSENKPIKILPYGQCEGANLQQCSTHHDADTVPKKDFKNFQEIKDAINDLFIRFNTSPKLYTKNDYYHLLMLLAKGLLFVYEDELTLGDNFNEVASINDDKKLELFHPVAKQGSIVREEDAASTLATVDFLSHYTLQWEEF